MTRWWQRTAHAALIAEALSLLAGRKLASPSAEVQPPLEPLSDSETRVLRYLPTNLSLPEIASELAPRRQLHPIRMIGTGGPV